MCPARSSNVNMHASAADVSVLEAVACQVLIVCICIVPTKFSTSPFAKKETTSLKFKRCCFKCCCKACIWNICYCFVVRRMHLESCAKQQCLLAFLQHACCLALLQYVTCIRPCNATSCGLRTPLWNACRFRKQIHGQSLCPS